jgi:hypothetical protein
VTLKNGKIAVGIPQRFLEKISWQFGNVLLSLASSLKFWLETSGGNGV